MEGTDRRQRIEPRPRSSTDQEWELFVRRTTADPLRHVGSVTAPTEATAYEQASKLFGRDQADIWICPATALTRYVARGVEASANRSGTTIRGGDTDDIDQ